MLRSFLPCLKSGRLEEIVDFSKMDPIIEKPESERILSQSSETFSMLRPEDEDNEDVYPRARSPTGLSVAFPDCRLAGDEKIEPEKEKRGDLLAGVMRDAARNGEDGNWADQVSEMKAEAKSVASSKPLPEDPTCESSYRSEILEDAQRLEPSLDPQILSDPVYHDLQPPKRECSVVLDSSNPNEVKVIHLEDSQASQASQVSLSSSRKREQFMEEAGESYFYPPNQLAAGRSLSQEDPGPHKRHRPGEGENLFFSLDGATAVDPPPGPLARRLTSAINRVNFTPILDITKNGESGFFPHDFPWEGPDQEVLDPTPEEIGESRFRSVKELVANEVLRTIPREEMISFVLVVRDTDGQIYIPSTIFFDRIITQMEIEILTKIPSLRTLFWSSSKWLGCGVLELSADSNLEEWRAALTSIPLGNNLQADTFPKDCLLMGPDVTVLLKEAHLEYKIEWMGRALVGRNTPLKGNVRVVCSKQYHAHDITRHAINMNGWQMVYLAGDCIFMEYLSRCPITFRFHVGPGSVVLRGGIRKPAFLTEQARAQFTWIRPGISMVPSLSLNPVQQVAATVPTSSSSTPPTTSSSSASGTAPKKRGPNKGTKRGQKNASLVKTSSTSSSTSPGVASSQPVTTCNNPPSSFPSSAPATTALLEKSCSEPALSLDEDSKNKKTPKPKNRLARLKTRAAKLKNCC